MELHIAILVFLFIIPAVLAAVARDLLRAAIALLVCSLGLTLLLFNLGAPLAGVFELSVCAGLISVLFINAISLTRPVTGEELLSKIKEHYRRFLALPFVILFVAVILWLNQEHLLGPLVINKEAEKNTVGQILWGLRGLDLIGQIIILLVGVFGVVALFKRGKSNG
ncbi:MAG: NADH-quinone oxidoreductase subunit J [Bacillota bacterium]